MAMIGDVVRRALGGVMRNVRYTALLLLAGSETLILEWLLRATAGRSLGLIGGAVAAAALVVANLLTLGLLPIFARRTSSGYRLGRVWLVGSLGALISGLPLAVAFLLFTPLAWLHPPSGDTLLLASGAAAVTLGFGSMFWGWLVGQRRVEVERLDLPLRGLPDALGGLRVAQISDLHIGIQMRAPLLRRLIARVNALEPDLIVITGDIFDFDPSYIEEGCRALAELEAPLGVWAVLGNHDAYTGAEKVALGLATWTSIHLLRDSWARIEFAGGAFALAGVEDPGRGWNEREGNHGALERLASEIPADLARLLLIHRPSWFGQAARLGFPLSLAGHTHGGQIALPRPGQHHNISRLISRWTRGLFRDAETGALLYVNRGLGIAGPPVRLNCAREISLLRLLAPRQ